MTASPDARSEGDKRAANRTFWEARVPVHVASEFYDVAGFLAGRNDLRRFEVDEMGPVDGLDLVHLQCHFGLDTLSWARLGARVTGLDFSSGAIDAAREVATQAGIEAEFVCADVYDAVEALGGRTFDVVYTGLGALCWIPDLAGWAEVVDRLLVPGGVAYLAEFHPIHQMTADDDLTITHGYFWQAEGTRWDDDYTYTDGAPLDRAYESWEWTHPVSAVVTVLLDRGLRLELFHEHPFTLFPRWPFLEHRDGAWWMPEAMPSLPLLYSIKVRKPT
ncbi:MAG TPA: class I SAM-dependent methyltransferase [Acidimicrobiales bacterium]|nr:class I SAM-dependent methyltransferase [Acidimicrobiales bacterium]